MGTLYLDNAATTHICKEVLDEMIASLNDYGNTEAKFYCYAEKAKENVKTARTRIAIGLGCEPDDIVFTSGATESNNLFIKGMALTYPNKKKIIISSIEHSSIRETAHYMEKFGYIVSEIPVDKDGKVNLLDLENEIDDNTLFVSIILVNNEIGTIQDIKSIDEICEKKNVILHMDATQAIGKFDIKMSEYRALKALTFTSHKIYGPKGIGALILKSKDGIKFKLTPLFHGGEQENGYRAGTLSNELIVGFGKAVELSTKDIESDNKKLKLLEEVLLSKLKDKFGSRIKLNNDFNDRIPGLINLQFHGVNNMVLLQKISPYIAASTGSACSVSKPSHVLKSIGLSDDEISYSLRFSLSKYTHLEELDVIDKL